MGDLVIPESHWQTVGTETYWRNFAPSWEKQLRANIEREPDPRKRFEEWLTKKADGDRYQVGVRLMFLEQPYLAWAEAIVRFGKHEAKRERQACISILQCDE